MKNGTQTTLNKNDKKAVKRAVQWLREYKHDAGPHSEPAIEANEIMRALEQVLQRDERTRDNVQLEAAKYSVKQDAHGWNGYCRNTKIKTFGADEQAAHDWLTLINMV